MSTTHRLGIEFRCNWLLWTMAVSSSAYVELKPSDFWIADLDITSENNNINIALFIFMDLLAHQPTRMGSSLYIW